MADLEYDVTVCDGKYRITYDKNMVSTVYRNGEPWDRSVLGDGMILALVQRIAELEDQLSTIRADNEGQRFYE